MNLGYVMLASHVANGHAETCLGSLILHNEDGSEHIKLIKMRNSRERSQYDGSRSIKSDLLTQSFIKQENFDYSDDDIFYLPLADWRKEFTNLTFAHIRPWLVSSLES